MALGFIKKVFSFSTKKTEDKNEDEKAAPDAGKAAAPRVRWEEEPRAPEPAKPPAELAEAKAPDEAAETQEHAETGATKEPSAPATGEPAEPLPPETEKPQDAPADSEADEKPAEHPAEVPVATEEQTAEPTAEEPQSEPVAETVESDTSSWEEWKPAISRRQPPVFPGLKKKEVDAPEAEAPAEDEKTEEAPAEPETESGTVHEKPAEAASADGSPEPEENELKAQAAESESGEEAASAIEPAAESDTDAESKIESEAESETKSEPEADAGEAQPSDEKSEIPSSEDALQEADSVPAETDVEASSEPARPEEPEPEPEPSGFFARLRQGLSRTSSQLTEQISSVFTKRKLDEDTLQDLEDVLIQSDLGLETALRITDSLSSGRYGRDISTEEVQRIMASEIGKVLEPVARPLELDLAHKPHVVLVVGVNGTGKTTTIGKLAAKLREGGLDVMLAAGDTFRAAAIEQLKIWGERTGSPVVSSKLGADAAGLAFDAWKQAKDAGSDVLIIDTAGRLQNKAELMAELEKIVRVLGKNDPEAPHTVLQTLDATTGQNAMNQVEIFRNVAGVNGLVMTKLDGTARGGILVAISAKHKLPVYFIGVGEGVEDLEPFEAREFASAIAGVPAGKIET